MLVSTFAAFAATSIILTGTFVGPDYEMNIDTLGRAHVEFSDGQSANVQFNTVFEYSNANVVARGVVINSTAPMRMMAGDTVNLGTSSKSLVVLRPDMSIRQAVAACWQGFNRTPEQPAYPCS